MAPPLGTRQAKQPEPPTDDELPDGMKPLYHPLTHTLAVAKLIWAKVAEGRGETADENQRLVLEVCRSVLGAECMGLVGVDGVVAMRVGESDLTDGELVAASLPVIDRVDLLQGKGPFGLSTSLRSDDGARHLKVIPITLNASLNSDYVPADTLLVAVERPSNESIGYELDEPLGRVIAGLLWAVALTREQAGDAGIDPTHIRGGEDLECVVLDSLRRIYAGVPFDAYNRRFELYRQQLRSLWFGYQPIYKMSAGGEVHIFGWEALARMGTKKGFPRWVFGVADMWGSKFKVELDLVAMLTVPEAFRASVTKGGYEELAQHWHLAINVNPSTVAVPAYQEAVAQAVNQLGSTTLTLELSEREGFQAPVAPIDGIDLRPHQARPDRRLLTELEPLKQLGVGIAIDDFGVDQGSVIRALDLKASLLKLDRTLVTADEDDAQAVFTFANTLANRYNAKVVAEGVETTAQLAAVWQNGITLVQAWIFTKGTDEVVMPDASEWTRIRAMVSEAQQT